MSIGAGAVSARSLNPFQQMPYSSLPERPSQPHPYYSSTPHELEMDSASLGKIRIHYREYGDGPPLLLIHGLMTSSYSWRYILEGLGAHYQLIIPDLPGAGRSGNPTVRFSAASMSAWIGEFQAALGVQGCAAVGNSLGGYLCMRHALADSSAFSRLVNIHALAFAQRRFHAMHAALSLPGAPEIFGWWLRRDTTRWAHWIVHYYNETLKSVEEAREYGDALATSEGTNAFVGYLRDVMAPRDFADFTTTLERRKAAGQSFPMPLQLIYADRDPMVPPATGDKLAELIPDAQFHRVKKSSHFTHVDSPAEVTALILDFLQESPSEEPELAP
ncbi:alpha/beta fold hydrolase [Nocardia arizonensis]|uniref:alpha/beta fold hydrolase n=1 Tax=Nocardia arizonensis TaxID=1141647 RepID=UPI0009E870E7|nr:alpha/beta hydrolase [Nocardia arizonensis]